ncbi:MAG TPA: CBS domain-containing protein [Candidatus Eremiobacteraceae bacterium]|nr:CBS domain-containing protein [Candidatus Eremiobacteraceae bacterium]
MRLREAFASELIGRPVTLHAGSQHVRIGRLEDVAVSGNDTFPAVTGLYIKGQDGVRRFAPFASVETLTPDDISVQSPPIDATAVSPPSDELLVNRAVLDKQILDVDGKKVVRVNDVRLAPAGAQMRLMAADVGFPGLLRRLGLRALGRQLEARPQLTGMPPTLISWEAVQPLQHDQASEAIRLRVPHARLNRIHPADLAAILQDLTASEQASLVTSLDEETAADAFEQLDVDTQLSILEDLKPERAADIIEKMEPDDAADLLGQIEQDKQQELLRLIEPTEAEDLRELLGHPEQTAGGLMTTQYLWIPPGLTVAQAFDRIRDNAGDAELVYYVYILDEREHIVGVCSLRELVMGRPDQAVAEISVEDVVTVQLEAPRDEVATTIARYDFIAVPVVDREDRMQGIVTVDDVIDVLLPEKLRKMLPHVGKSRSKAKPRTQTT